VDIQMFSMKSDELTQDFNESYGRAFKKIWFLSLVEFKLDKSMTDVRPKQEQGGCVQVILSNRSSTSSS
jgi:hypothetical protein